MAESLYEVGFLVNIWAHNMTSPITCDKTKILAMGTKPHILAHHLARLKGLV